MPGQRDLVSTALTALALSLLLSSTCLGANTKVQVPTVSVKPPSVVVKPTVVMRPTTSRSVLRNNTRRVLQGKSSDTPSPGVAVYGVKAGGESVSLGRFRIELQTQK